MVGVGKMNARLNMHRLVGGILRLGAVTVFLDTV
jgi:hypothetical protein